MENGTFETAFPTENGDIPLLCSFTPEGSLPCFFSQEALFYPCCFFLVSRLRQRVGLQGYELNLKWPSCTSWCGLRCFFCCCTEKSLWVGMPCNLEQPTLLLRVFEKNLDCKIHGRKSLRCRTVLLLVWKYWSTDTLMTLKTLAGSTKTCHVWFMQVIFELVISPWA